ncbi:hypothetical protein GCM10009550_65760 [Actinocorallia libanotica]|uniref:Uncharacterized protein n=1 Tax=Actinocorallia libanotica TaxID=46162 RepID=A0ABN1RVR6_9ACTN
MGPVGEECEGAEEGGAFVGERVAACGAGSFGVQDAEFAFEVGEAADVLVEGALEDEQGPLPADRQECLSDGARSRLDRHGARLRSVACPVVLSGWLRSPKWRRAGCQVSKSVAAVRPRPARSVARS